MHANDILNVIIKNMEAQKNIFCRFSILSARRKKASKKRSP